MRSKVNRSLSMGLIAGMFFSLSVFANYGGDIKTVDSYSEELTKKADNKSGTIIAETSLSSIMNKLGVMKQDNVALAFSSNLTAMSGIEDNHRTFKQSEADISGEWDSELDEKASAEEKNSQESESTQENSDNLEDNNSSEENAETSTEDDSKRVEEKVEGLIIAQADNYVNIRDRASLEGEIVGKLYDESVGIILEDHGEWVKIKSGSVTGFVNAEYVLTGTEAEELAEKVGKKLARVNTTTLKVRKEPSLDAIVIGLVPGGDILSVSKEVEGWVKVSVEEGTGYVSTDYVEVYIENTKAESIEEEKARLKREETERQQAVSSASKAGTTASTSGGSQTLGRQVADYAMQFIGNPYVYGGTSLTNGTDCSGFVMGVYKKFGVSLPRSSGEQGRRGTRVDGLGNARPGDLVWYSGHIGIYIGNGNIVSASNSKPYPKGGIKISNANYRTILSIRRIF